MDKIYDLKIFKEQLEDYMNKGRSCDRNRQFLYNNKDYIHINYKLVFARHITGGRHYWWILDGKIYDPTIHQFTSKSLDKQFGIEFPDIQKLFDQIYLNQYINSDNKSNHYNYYYDESTTDSNINTLLVPWYKLLNYSEFII
jgi:hypothetical protein